MIKRYFTSLLLGFGVTLAVLVAISMPPGGWSVAVGVALGLLAALPLFIIVMALLKRQNYHPNQIYSSEPRYDYSEPQMVPPVVVIQQQLPQGASMPLPPNYSSYNYQQQSDDYVQDYSSDNIYNEYYEQQNPAKFQEVFPAPRLAQKSARRRKEQEYEVRHSQQRPLRKQRRQRDYGDQFNAGYSDYAYPSQNQPRVVFEDWDNSASYEVEDYYYGQEPLGEAIAPPDIAYYEEQQVRRRRDARNYKVQPTRQYDSNYNSTQENSFDGQDDVVEAQYREINMFGEE